MAERVYLSIGSNQGDRLGQLRGAVHALRARGDIQVARASPVYECEPWEQEPGRLAHETAWYLNCVVEVFTDLSAGDLLARLGEIERELGRTRPAGTPEAGRFVPRSIDIDILLYGRRVISGPDELHVPHLLAHERAFVLRPLADLAPDLEHPTLYRTVAQLLQELADEHAIHRGDAPAAWFED